MPQPPLSENTEGFLLKQTFLKSDYHCHVYYNPEKSKICGCFHVTKKPHLEADLGMLQHPRWSAL